MFKSSLENCPDERSTRGGSSRSGLAVYVEKPGTVSRPGQDMGADAPSADSRRV